MSFNFKTEFDTVLDKTLFQGYQQLRSVHSLSLNSPQTLNRWPGFQSFLCCQLREILSIYRPTKSFHENNQPVQGWIPATKKKKKY